MKKVRLAHIQRNKYRKRDRKLRNSQPTKQERLINDLVKWAESEPLIESIAIEAVTDKED